MKWVFATVLSAAVLFGTASCGTTEETKQTQVTAENIDSLLTAHPDSVPLLLKRGEMRFANYQFDLSMQDAAKAYRLEKNNPKAKLLFAEVLNNRSGRTPEDVANAQALYQDILKKEKKNVRALVGVASTYTYQQKFEESFEYLNKALRIDRHYRNAYVLKGTNFMTMGQKEKAISSYETAVQQDPEFYEAYFFLANIYEADGNSQCVEYYRNALELRPDSREIRYKLAYAQQNFGKIPDAQKNYRVLASDTIDFYSNRGYFHQGYIHQFETQDIDSAIYFYNEALKAEPRHVESWHNLGMCYDWAGNKSKALQSFGKALKYDPEFELSRNFADSIRLLPASVKLPRSSEVDLDGLPEGKGKSQYSARTRIMRIQPKYIPLVSDAFIPLLGLFVWNWSLYFILLFYLLDLLAREVLTHYKTREIYRAQGLKNTQKWQQKGVLSGVLFLTVVAAIHGAVWCMQPEINFLKELQLFWEYEELGVQQGYILVPLIIYAAYAQFRMSFLMPGKAKHVLMDSLWKQHFIALLLILAGSVLAGGIGLFVTIPDVLSVCTIVVCAAAYSFYLEKI